MRIVLDANVLVRAHPRSRSTARKLVAALMAGGHTLVVSNELIAGRIKVLRYPRLQQRFGFTEEELFEYMQFLQQSADLVMLSQPYLAAAS